MTHYNKFTIIIPTKNRSETLKWALKTCVTQDYENLEIIISDNFSQDDTREVVDSFNDNRIKYINTGKQISVTGNFEFALSHATGDYVGFIGDDDGYMPDAMAEINDFVNDKNADAVKWKMPVYGWNSLSSGAKNTLSVPLKYQACRHNSFDLLKKLLEFDKSNPLTYSDLIWLYHGFVKKSEIMKLKNSNGKIFNSINPDIYASVALSSFVNYFWETDKPYSIPGASASSTSNISKIENLNQFYIDNDMDFHPNFKKAFSRYIYTAESFLQAKEFIPEANNFDINIEGLINRAIEDAVFLPPEHYAPIAESVRHIGKVYNLEETAEKAVNDNPNDEIALEKMLHGYNFLSDYLIVKFDENKVKNIYDATLECRKILDNKSFKMRAVESVRFLLSSASNYGIKKSLKKAIKTAGF